MPSQQRFHEQRYAAVVLDADVVAAALERGLEGWIRGGASILHQVPSPLAHIAGSLRNFIAESGRAIAI